MGADCEQAKLNVCIFACCMCKVGKRERESEAERGREATAMGVTFATCSKVASAGQDALYIESFKRNESHKGQHINYLICGIKQSDAIKLLQLAHTAYALYVCNCSC